MNALCFPSAFSLKNFAMFGMFNDGFHCDISFASVDSAQCFDCPASSKMGMYWSDVAVFCQ